jgi:hypothetical protein
VRKDMCGLGVVACGAPVDWELPACPGTPADGFVPRLALHAHAELSRPVPASHLAARGPDGARTLTLTAGVATAAIHVTASVLGIRGSAPALQPLVSTVTGDMLSFNGEVFRYDNDDDDDSNVSGAVVAGDEADSHALLRALERAPSPGTVLARVHGPWALCYWRASSATLYFGRDAIGRRSLLVARTARGLALCSVAVPLGALCGAEGAEDPADARALAADWQELPPLPAGGLWQLTLARAAGAGAGAGGSAARFVVRACLPRLAPACALRPPAARLRDSVRADEAPALAPSLPSGRANGAACFQPSLTQPPPAAEPRSKPPPITCADAARTALHAALSEAVRARVQLIGAAADAPAAARGAGAPCCSAAGSTRWSWPRSRTSTARQECPSSSSTSPSSRTRPEPPANRPEPNGPRPWLRPRPRLRLLWRLRMGDGRTRRRVHSRGRQSRSRCHSRRRSAARRPRWPRTGSRRCTACASSGRWRPRARGGSCSSTCRWARSARRGRGSRR